MNLILNVIIIIIIFFFCLSIQSNYQCCLRKLSELVLFSSYYDYLNLLLELFSLNHIYTWYLFVLYFLWMRLIMQLGMPFNML